MASSTVIAGVASPAVARVASPADHAGMAFPAIVGAASPTVAEVAPSAVDAGVASRPTLLGWRSWPLLGRRPLPLLRWHP